MMADICLLLEGTYPYVRGGVAAWVHQIIRELPELRFSLVFIGGRPEDYGEPKYELPDNVVHLETHYLSKSLSTADSNPRPGDRASFGRVSRMHEALRREAVMERDTILEALAGIGRPEGIPREDFLYSEAAWEYIRGDHLQRARTVGFVDYFWTVRIMHAPLLLLGEVALGVPEARVFHTISTGYAGMLGVFLAGARGRPLILTEHGIYTKERKIDLAQAGWIREADPGLGGSLSDGMGYLRRLWIRFFEGLGRLTYRFADPIVSLYEGNRQRQIADGAPEERAVIVPNGVRVDRFVPALTQRPEKVPPILGFIGRLVPIKDVKTFIRAVAIVCAELPGAKGWIVGSSEEAPEYAAECRALVDSLGLQDKIEFLGFCDVRDILPQLGLVVLTSISEAQPLVLLECFAAGVPAVATDVGACRELIEGRLPEDRALGPAGAVVSIGDPEASGRACLALLEDERAWRRAQRSALVRVRRFYTEGRMMSRYREIYYRALAASLAGTSPRDEER